MNLGFVFVLISAIIWGLVYNIDQRILLKTSPLTMFLVGGIMQIIVLIPYIFIQKGNEEILSILKDKNQLLLLFISEMLLIIAGIAVLYAVKYLDAPTAASLEIIYPFFVILFAILFFGWKININIIIGLIFIFIGSIIIINNKLYIP